MRCGCTKSVWSCGGEKATDKQEEEGAVAIETGGAICIAVTSSCI